MSQVAVRVGRGFSLDSPAPPVVREHFPGPRITTRRPLLQSGEKRAVQGSSYGRTWAMTRAENNFHQRCGERHLACHEGMGLRRERRESPYMDNEFGQRAVDVAFNAVHRNRMVAHTSTQLGRLRGNRLSARNKFWFQDCTTTGKKAIGGSQDLKKTVFTVNKSSSHQGYICVSPIYKR